MRVVLKNRTETDVRIYYEKAQQPEIKEMLPQEAKSVEEAAHVDGAGSFTTYVLIVLPMVKPMIMFLALTSFTAPWMDFIFPRLILRSDDKKTLALGLFELINGRANDNFTMFAAGALLVAVPFTLLFMAGQKFLLKSLAAGAVKE